MLNKYHSTRSTSTVTTRQVASSRACTNISESCTRRSLFPHKGSFGGAVRLLNYSLKYRHQHIYSHKCCYKTHISLKHYHQSHIFTQMAHQTHTHSPKYRHLALIFTKYCNQEHTFTQILTPNTYSLQYRKLIVNWRADLIETSCFYVMRENDHLRV